MKRILIFLIIAFLCIATLAISVTGSYENRVNNVDLEEVNYYALVVGVEEFAGMETPYQEYLDESATAFYEKLLESENWEAENIKFLLNENATKENISDSIVNWLDDREDEKDIVLIYYADHGWRIPINQRKYGYAFVCTYNTTENKFDENKISDKEFDLWVDELDSKNIVIILDHCYSGRMFALRQFGRIFLASGGKYLFCPCNWSDSLESTIFTHYILEGLNGVADINNDGWVTAREAFHYARWPVIWHSLWHHFPYIWDTIYGVHPVGPQIPFLYDRHIGNIPLIKYK